MEDLLEKKRWIETWGKEEKFPFFLLEGENGDYRTRKETMEEDCWIRKMENWKTFFVVLGWETKWWKDKEMEKL